MVKSVIMIQQVGSFYHPEKSRFVVWAPLKKKVELVIESPGGPCRYAMQKNEYGYWSMDIKAEPGTKYRYRIDEETEYPDPASLSQPNGVHGASELLDRNAFHWTDQHWKGLPMADMVIYELHTGTFSNQQNFAGIHDRLDYLSNLGVNAIEIMPVGQFPGSRNWGYDGVFPFAVQQSYGGANGLKELVDIAHRKNMAVLLDVVYNHVGPDGNYFDKFGPYFTDKYKIGWGSAFNFDDAWCDGPRHYFISNALMWLEEFHIDGLRLDAVHAIKDYSARHLMRQLKEEVIACEARTGVKKILIAETDLNDHRYIDPFDKGGYGLDGQWIDEFHHALHALLTGERAGYYEDFGEASHLEKAFRDTYVYNGNYSIHRKRNFGSDPKHNPFDQFVVFTQNHDQVGNRLLGERLSTLVSFEELKIAAASVLLSPYVPLIFMGEEYGEKNPFLFFTDHSDAELIEAVRKGRKEEFAYFHLEGDFADPQSPDTFNRSMLSWDYTSAESSALMNFYQYLIAFRKNREAMQARSRDNIKVSAPAEKVIVLERISNKDHLVIVFNYAKDNVSLQNQWGNLKKIFDSASSEWYGPGETLISQWDKPTVMDMRASSVLVFEKSY